jgi:hypothetical protein
MVDETSRLQCAGLNRLEVEGSGMVDLPKIHDETINGGAVESRLD